MAALKQLTDINDNKIYPITHATGVIYNQSTIDLVIDNIYTTISDINTGGGTGSGGSLGTIIIANLSVSSIPAISTSNDNTYINSISEGLVSSSIKVKASEPLSVSSLNGALNFGVAIAGKGTENITSTGVISATCKSKPSSTITIYDVLVDHGGLAYVNIPQSSTGTLGLVSCDGVIDSNNSSGALYLKKELNSNKYGVILNTANSQNMGCIKVGEEENVSSQDLTYHTITPNVTHLGVLITNDGFAYVNVPDYTGNGISILNNNNISGNLIAYSSKEDLYIYNDTKLIPNGISIGNYNTVFDSNYLKIKENDTTLLLLSKSAILPFLNISLGSSGNKFTELHLTKPIYPVLSNTIGTEVYPSKIHRYVVGDNTSIEFDLKDELTYTDRIPIYSIIITGANNDSTISFSETINWSNGVIPSISSGETIEVNIMDDGSSYLGIWMKYKQ